MAHPSRTKIRAFLLTISFCVSLPAFANWENLKPYEETLSYEEAKRGLSILTHPECTDVRGDGTIVVAGGYIVIDPARGVLSFPERGSSEPEYILPFGSKERPGIKTGFSYNKENKSLAGLRIALDPTFDRWKTIIMDKKGFDYPTYMTSLAAYLSELFIKQGVQKADILVSPSEERAKYSVAGNLNVVTALKKVDPHLVIGAWTDIERLKANKTGFTILDEEKPETISMRSFVPGCQTAGEFTLPLHRYRLIHALATRTHFISAQLAMYTSYQFREHLKFAPMQGDSLAYGNKGKPYQSGGGDTYFARGLVAEEHPELKAIAEKYKLINSKGYINGVYSRNLFINGTFSPSTKAVAVGLPDLEGFFTLFAQTESTEEQNKLNAQRVAEQVGATVFASVMTYLEDFPEAFR